VYVDDDNSVETVESSAGSDLADWEGLVHPLEVWLSRGRAEVAARLAFTWIAAAEVCANAASFIRSAISPLIKVVTIAQKSGVLQPTPLKGISSRDLTRLDDNVQGKIKIT
jgi:hypothetical protein